MEITLSPKTVHNLRVMLEHHPDAVQEDDLNTYVINRMRWDDKNMIQMYAVSQKYDRIGGAKSPWYKLTPFGLRCAQAIPEDAGEERVTVEVEMNGRPSEIVLEQDEADDVDKQPEAEEPEIRTVQINQDGSVTDVDEPDEQPDADPVPGPKPPTRPPLTPAPGDPPPGTPKPKPPTRPPAAEGCGCVARQELDLIYRNFPELREPVRTLMELRQRMRDE